MESPTSPGPSGWTLPPTASLETEVGDTSEEMKSALDFAHDKAPSTSLIDFNPLEFGSEFVLPLDNIYFSTADPLGFWSPLLSPTQSSIVCTLRAPTSPLQIVDSATLTYLNQGQTYHIAINESLTSTSSTVTSTPASCATDASPTASSGSSSLIRTAISLRLQQGKVITESEPHFSTWVSSNPDRNILEIDKLASTGISNVRGLTSFGGVLFAWDQSEGCCASFRINCLSTDFAAHRRGGEKGAYLRLQLDSALVDAKSHSYKIIDSCSCLIKVFKGAGAERRLKLDHDKVLKANATESASGTGSNGPAAGDASNSGDNVTDAPPTKDTVLVPCAKGVSKPLPASAFAEATAAEASNLKRIKLEPGVSTSNYDALRTPIGTGHGPDKRTSTTVTALSAPLVASAQDAPTPAALTSTHTGGSPASPADTATATHKTADTNTQTTIMPGEGKSGVKTDSASQAQGVQRKRGTPGDSCTDMPDTVDSAIADARGSGMNGNRRGSTAAAAALDSGRMDTCKVDGDETSAARSTPSGRDHGMPKSLARLRLNTDDDGDSDDDNGRTARPRVALQVTEHSSVRDVQQWLTENHFADCKEQFKSYNGHLLLKLEKSDFVQICAPAEGIRLYTTLRYGRDAEAAKLARKKKAVATPLSVTTYTQTESPPPA